MSKKTPKVTHGSPDKPLKIGGKEIQCYVLDNETRVITQASFLEALGRHRKANVRKEGGEERLPAILQGKAINPFISQELLEKSEPIKFKTETGVVASGYRAEILPMLCEVYLNARDEGVLPSNQKHVAAQAEILIRALAHVGIIALVDEATGYQEVRDRLALQKILDKFITDEWGKWTKTFPDEYYKELFRLKRVPYPGTSMKKPQYVGHWTNDIVYKRLAPGVLKTLKEKNPTNKAGHRKRRHHQYLTKDYGHPSLKEHLSNVIFLMKGSANWNKFYRTLQRAAPKYGDNLELPFEDVNDD